MKHERVHPGRYFVLQFDFDLVDRFKNRNMAEMSLNLMLNRSIKQFYKTYAISQNLGRLSH